MGDTLDRQVALLVHPFHAAERGSGHRRAVIAVAPCNHLRLRRTAERLPVDPRHAEPGIGRFRSGIGEEHMVHVRPGAGGDFLRQKCRRRRGGAEKRVVIGQLVHLALHDIGDLAAAISDIHAPEAGEGVEIFLAGAVIDENPFRALDDAGAGGIQLAHIGKGMKVMGGIDGGEVGQRLGDFIHDRSHSHKGNGAHATAPAEHGRAASIWQGWRFLGGANGTSGCR
ncbi:hypothetical protein D3C86_1464900 [compost metagenome]